jgi:hypothetical protein
LKNHGAEQDFVAMWGMAEDLFKLPEEEKMKYEQGDEGLSFGYALNHKIAVTTDHQYIQHLIGTKLSATISLTQRELLILLKVSILPKTTLWRIPKWLVASTQASPTTT